MEKQPSKCSQFTCERAKGPGVEAELHAIAHGLSDIAYALKQLGVGNAMTEMGAIEHHAHQVTEAAETVAGSVRELAQALRDQQAT